MEHVILVDEQDNAIGTMEKMEAHKKGVLHRAFSILLFNDKGEILLQKRAAAKYHSGGLWTNTCCSHPLPNERIDDATHRRLKQEMGIDVPLKFEFKFIYKAELDKNLAEHEVDHVYTGYFNGMPAVNPAEVDDWRFVSLNLLRESMVQNPSNYTVWFKLIMQRAEINNLISR